MSNTPRSIVSPLDIKQPIVDSDTGCPTLQFLRLWQQLFGNEQGTFERADGAATAGLITSSGLTMSPSRVLGRISPLTGAIEELTISQVLDLIGGNAQGDILYRDAAGWNKLPAGVAGQILTTGGPGANPAWAAAPTSTLWDFSPPLASAFTLFSGDANAAVLTDDAQVGLKVTTGTASAASIIRGGYKTLPAVGTDFSVTIKCSFTSTTNTFQGGGLVIYESATGKSHDYLLFESPGNDQIRRQTIAGVYTSDAKVALAPGAFNAWLKIARVGTNLIFSRSADGKNWATVQSIAQNTYLTTAPDRIGPAVWLGHATDIPVLTVQYWAQTGF